MADEVKIAPVTSPHKLGEGPHWDVQSQTLYYVDIWGQKILAMNGHTKAIKSMKINYGPVGVAVPVKGHAGQLLVASRTDIFLVNWDGQRDVDELTLSSEQRLAQMDSDRNDTRANDGKCDRKGRFFVGTMDNESKGTIAPNRGNLYRFDKDSDLTLVLPRVSISNGLAWSANDRVMYYIDSPTRVVYAFDYDDGTMKNQREVFDFDEYNITGVPDGMTIDTDDNLWIAVYDGACVLNVNPAEKKLLRTIEMPADKITSVAFGGPDLDILYVTSAYQGMSEAERKAKPYSGCVFEVKGLGVKGYPANEYVNK